MLILCGACGILVLLLAFTRFMSKSRKGILILMEVMAFFLLWFDRAAYIYAGDISRAGYIMVRVSNFIVFFLTPALALGLTLYVADWLLNEGKLTKVPTPLRIATILSVIGMILAVVAAFTNLYYYFDEANTYHRGSGFLIAYIIPVVCPIIQFTVVAKYRKVFSNLIYYSIVLYIFVPILCGITQIFTYGISIVNISMVAVSISMYIFMYLDLNNTVEHAHEIEIQNMQGEQKRMHSLFDQTAMAFVSAVEKKDESVKGIYVKIAQIAQKIAEQAGKSAEDCEKVYYAALLHDAGLIDEDILTNFTEYPYLTEGAKYCRENYDGSGYPEGLSGEKIPEIARIISVAADYVSMTTKNSSRDELPVFVARENFVKDSGTRYDPHYADIMVKIIDSFSIKSSEDTGIPVDDSVVCGRYRENTSRGISVENDVRTVTFRYETCGGRDDFSAPSIVLFDSYDGRVHEDEESIEKYHYLEYAEIWFDKYSVSTAARNIEEKQVKDDDGECKDGEYVITAGRYEDHLRLLMKSKDFAKEVIVALPSRSKAAYIGLTGENCKITEITASATGEKVGENDIQRIAQPVSYIDHLEADLKNVQIDRWMSDSTEGVEVDGKLMISFHTQSLPEADLIWHCPYIVLYYSEDGRIGGPDYREYNLIKLNGEDQGDKEFAKNRFVMKKSIDFPGWDEWKIKNKEGIEVEVLLEKKGEKVFLRTENLGINIENVTTVTDDKEKVYVSISGDQVALTDIRIN